MSVSQKHPYHLVDPSPWLLLGSLETLASTIGGVMYIHSFAEGGTLLNLGLGMILYTMFVWWHDIIHEFTYKRYHTFVVQLRLCY
jgi:cytochrome c oxidase subunit 3